MSNSKKEKHLIERCRNGDLAAFDELVRIHQDRVYNLALRLLGNPDDALDLSQDVFLSAFRKIKSFRGESALSTWLYRITVNLAKNFWKHSQRRGASRTVSLDEPIESEEGKSILLQIPDSNPGPRELAAGREMLAILQEKLRTLSLEHRQVLLLRFSEQLSYDEIAEVLDCSVGTVKSRINRARVELKKIMELYL